MIVLDSYAVLAFLKGEPAAGPVAQLIGGENEVALTALGVAEIIDHLVRLAGVDEDDAALDVAQLALSQPLSVDEDLGLRAGMLRARHYHRQRRAVSLADCVAAQLALTVGGELATADPHLLDMCHAEGIAVLPLPDSAGRIWAP